MKREYYYNLLDRLVFSILVCNFFVYLENKYWIIATSMIFFSLCSL